MHTAYQMYSESNVTFYLKRVINKWQFGIIAASRQVAASGTLIGQLITKREVTYVTFLMQGNASFDTVSRYYGLLALVMQ